MTQCLRRKSARLERESQCQVVQLTELINEPASKTDEPAGGQNLLPYILQKDIYAAVQCAQWLLRNTELPPGVAVCKAADKYRVPSKDVAHLLGKLGSAVKARKRKR